MHLNALLTATIVMAKAVWMVTMAPLLAMHLIALVNGLNNLKFKNPGLDVSGAAYQYDFYEDDSDFLYTTR